MKEMKEKYGKVDSEMEEVYEALNKLHSEAKKTRNFGKPSTRLK
jgi:hypothetical protein